MMNGFKSQYSSIKGISEKRRLPRLGKIRLGFKAKTGSGTEYPAELPFFSLPPEVASLYGFKTAGEAVARAGELGVTRQAVLDYINRFYGSLAEQIDVMFPLNDLESVFPQAYKWYGNQKGLKCIGNGETAIRGAKYVDDTAVTTDAETDGKMVEIECPCNHLKSDENPRGECTKRAHLLVMVPNASMGGVYQIDLSSYNSMVDVNSSIDYITAMTHGRFAQIMLQLVRKPTTTYHEEKGETHKQIHWTLQVKFNGTIDQLNQLIEGSKRVIAASEKYMLPPPEDVNPAHDIPAEGVILVEHEEAEVEAVDAPVSPEQNYQNALGAVNAAASIDELQDVWRSVMATAGDFSKKQLADLTKAKDVRKKTFTAVPM